MARRGIAVLVLTASILAAGGSHSQTVAARPSLAQPALSPDGKEIAFVSGGDIWAAPAQGGTAHLLVSHPATEERPIYSPKGDQLAFSSTRDGAANLYVLTFATGVVRRLTFADSNERLDASSPDGRWVYFSSNAGDVGGQNDIYRVATTGGTPLPVSAEAFLSEFNGAPSPDGLQIALMAKGGQAITQWWRNGHSHLDETELWLKPIAASGAYRRLSAPAAGHRQTPLADVEPGRPDALFHERRVRGRKPLADAARRGDRAAKADQLHRRPPAVSLDRRRRPLDRLRT